MTSDEFTKSMLVLIVWRIAGGDGLDSMLAIACTLANRVKAEKKPWLEIIGNEMVPGSMPDTREPSFLRLLQSLDAIYEGRARDASNGAIKWADLAAESAPDGLSLCCRVGRWSFFKTTC
jgi:hypothetical protein